MFGMMHLWLDVLHYRIQSRGHLYFQSCFLVRRCWFDLSMAVVAYSHVLFAQFALCSFGLDSCIFWIGLCVYGLGAFNNSRLCLYVIPDGVLIWLVVQVCAHVHTCINACVHVCLCTGA